MTRQVEASSLDCTRIRGGLLAAVVPFMVLAASCTLDDASAPELTGPSGRARQITLSARPDSLVADGFSSSVLEAVMIGPDGARLQGATIEFDLRADRAGPDVLNLIDFGNIAPLNGPRPVAGGVESGPVSAVTDGDGVARARYWAPFRTDQENNAIATITAREAGTNFRFAEQAVAEADIFLRAANRPSFPGGAVCDFIWEPDKLSYRVGEGIAFTATQIVGASGQAIARYEWIFDTEDEAVGRTPVYAFRTPGTKTIILITHESITGARETCSTTLDVVP